MEIAITAIIILILGLLASLIWGGDLKKKRDAANRRRAERESELEDVNRRNTQLESERDDADRRSTQLESERNAADQRSEQLDHDLNEAKQDIAELRAELQQIAQSNDDAIRLLYLTTLSLQICGIALRRELDRYTRLDKQYRGLANAYNDLVDTYGGFREEVKSKARGRLVKKGVGIALAFVPGLALIDILSDLADILAVATEADEAIDVFDVELGDTQESIASSSSDMPEVSESDMPIDNPSLLPLIPMPQVELC